MQYKLIAHRTLAAAPIAMIVLGMATQALANDAAAAAGGAFKQDHEIFKSSCKAVTSVKTWIFQVAYVLGAIGLVIIAFSAFLGKFKFTHLASLAGGLFIIGVADALIDFGTSGTQTDCVTANADVDFA